MLEYKIVAANASAGVLGLMQKVNDHIQGGWMPQGGIAVLNRDPSSTTSQVYFYQAMTRDLDPSPTPLIQLPGVRYEAEPGSIQALRERQQASAERLKAEHENS